MFIHPVCNTSHLLIPSLHAFSSLPFSPWATTGLCSVSVSLFLFCRQVHLCRILDFTLTYLLSTIISFAPSGIIFFFFLWLSDIPLCMHTHTHTHTPPHIHMHNIPCFFIHSSVDERVVCLYVLTVVNGAAVNLGVRVSFRIRVLSRYMPRSGIAGSYGNSYF